MGLTKPVVHVDEASIDDATMDRILACASPAMVLVGGQALAFWMHRYSVGPKAKPGQGFNASVTTDADFLGSIEHARRLSSALGARLIVPDPRAMTALIAQIKLRTVSGLEHNIDVLHQIYDVGGLRKSIDLTRRAQSRATVAEIAEGRRIRVLHPLDVLASRIQNAAGLVASKGEHVLTQAGWAIKVARIAIERAASGGDETTDRPGALAQEVARLALSAAGRAVADRHAIETAEAIPFSVLLEKVDGFAKQRAAILRSLHKQGRMRHVPID